MSGSDPARCTHREKVSLSLLPYMNITTYGKVTAQSCLASAYLGLQINSVVFYEKNSNNKTYPVKKSSYFKKSNALNGDLNSSVVQKLLKGFHISRKFFSGKEKSQTKAPITLLEPSIIKSINLNY